MNPIAISIGSTALYWSSLILVLGVAAWLALSRSLWITQGGRGSLLWLYFPPVFLFSVVFSRFLHWYCHTEQYSGFFSAMFHYAGGGYCLPGVLLGVYLAALLLAKLHLVEKLSRFLDALAPGAALGIAFIRLSALFSSACRGKLVITDSFFQHLPFGAAVTTSSGGIEFRFASFFVEFLLLLVLALCLLRFFLRRKRHAMWDASQDGDTARLFLLCYSAIELIIDSTRYDSSFLRSNGFVSLVQIVSAGCLLGLLLYYSIRGVRFFGARPLYFGLWLLWLVGLGGVGYLEYLIQRHGNWYLFCYSLMTLACLCMVLSVYGIYRSLRRSS